MLKFDTKLTINALQKISISFQFKNLNIYRILWLKRHAILLE